MRILNGFKNYNLEHILYDILHKILNQRHIKT